MKFSLPELGWTTHQSSQLSIEEYDEFKPARIASVHRTDADALTCDGPVTLVFPKEFPTSNVAVGDWAMLDGENQIVRLLDRVTLLKRRAAGEDKREQLLAANVDTLFIVTSCNADFNPARLERYLVLANGAGCHPVIILTKPDLCDDPENYIKKAESLSPGLSVICINAKDQDQASKLLDWWKSGQTAALVGSSGVGKSTLAATLTDLDIKAQSIREDDAKGRHTTTARHLYRTSHGGWLIDTPGMRALRLQDATEGIGAVFSDLDELEQNCRFNDCQHATEPGCAILAEIEAGNLDSDRVRRWKKLQSEDARNSETVAQARSRTKALGRYYKRHIEEARGRKGD